MHSSQIILALTLIATASPALAAPLPSSGPCTDNTKFARAFTEEAGLQARAPISFGPLGKELLKGLAGGAGLSAVFGGISALTGGSQKREITERQLGSVLGKLIGATDDALGTVVKNGAISGAAFGTSSSLGGGLLDKVFGRELEAREPISFGPLGKELLKGLAGGAGLSAVFGGISALTGGNQRREFGDGMTQEEADELEHQLQALMDDNKSIARRQGVAGAVAKSGLGSLIGKAVVGGLGSAIGGFGVDKLFDAFGRREFGDGMTQEEADELERQLGDLMNKSKPLSRRQGVAGAVAKSGLGSLIGKAVVGGLGSAIGGFGVDKLFDAFGRREFGDGMTQEEADELERQLSEMMKSTPTDAGKRDLEARINLGPVTKGIIGLGTSLGVGAIASQGLDAIQGLFNREFGDGMTQEEADELERQLSDMMNNKSVDAGKRDLEARINLGPVTKGIIGLGTSLGVGAIASQGLDAVQGLFQREASLNELD